ncbi:hypothetical protein [Streptomyces acidicola]|uniref:hypothetical protein n=1 Tax=Streptomyces acidicola TaxID=2596892 RepID=UPI003430308C
MRAASAGSFQSAAVALPLPLVAQDRDGQVIGALLGIPSGTVISTVAQLPGYQEHVLLSILKYAKSKLLRCRTTPAAAESPRSL